MAGIVATNLKCGDWRNPLGIDDATPRLTWQLQCTSPASRAQMQGAYRVLVASSANILNEDTGDLWDSGRVSSSLPSTVYSGSALPSEKQVFWKVRVWDKANKPSGWSAANSWTMGLLGSSDWRAAWLAANPHTSYSLKGCNWIWYPEGKPAMAAPVASRYFIKSFVLNKKALESAALLVTADNGYTSYLNGTEVGMGNNWRSATPFSVASHLQPGTNVLAVLATNRGSSPNPAGLIA